MTKMSAPIALTKPVKRSETEIFSIQIRKPGAGELRGLQLNMLIAGDVDQHLKLIPRISHPVIHEAELADAEIVEVEDFTEIVNEVIGFLLSNSIRASLPPLSTK